MATKSDLQDVKQGQVYINHSVAQLTTAVEALAGGQAEMKETMATKADVQDLKAEVVKKIKDHDERIEALEKEASLPHPHKH